MKHAGRTPPSKKFSLPIAENEGREHTSKNAANFV
jgi:hypothetical protein